MTTKTAPSLGEILSTIGRMDAAELEAVVDAASGRRKALRAERTDLVLDEFDVGDDVVLDGLSPKYVNGARGTIVGRANTRLMVRFDDDVDPRITARFGATARVPASAIRAAA